MEHLTPEDLEAHKTTAIINALKQQRDNNANTTVQLAGEYEKAKLEAQFYSEQSVKYRSQYLMAQEQLHASGVSADVATLIEERDVARLDAQQLSAKLHLSRVAVVELKLKLQQLYLDLDQPVPDLDAMLQDAVSNVEEERMGLISRTALAEQAMHQLYQLCVQSGLIIHTGVEVDASYILGLQAHEAVMLDINVVDSVQQEDN